MSDAKKLSKIEKLLSRYEIPTEVKLKFFVTWLAGCAFMFFFGIVVFMEGAQEGSGRIAFEPLTLKIFLGAFLLGLVLKRFIYISLLSAFLVGSLQSVFQLGVVFDGFDLGFEFFLLLFFCIISCVPVVFLWSRYLIGEYKN